MQQRKGQTGLKLVFCIWTADSAKQHAARLCQGRTRVREHPYREQAHNVKPKEDIDALEKASKADGERRAVNGKAGQRHSVPR